MNKTFTYSVLKYRSSYILDERVNIGLLFSFVNNNKVVFIHPKSLSRLSCLHPQIKLSSVKAYLNDFKQKAKDFNQKQTSFNDHKELQQAFLLEDGNCFFFSEVKLGKYDQIDPIVDFYHQQYFKAPKKSVNKHDEIFLIKSFSDTLQRFAPKKIHLFKRDIKHKNELGETKFDYAWQNGKTNLVKSISFDLQLKDSIQQKSFRWYGELSKLRDNDLDHNFKFDLLISRPRKKELFNFYDKAVQLISDIPGPKSIIEETALKTYILKAVDTVKPFEGNIFN